MQRLVHVGLLPAVYRYQALGKVLKQSRSAKPGGGGGGGSSDDDDDMMLEDKA